MNPQYKQYENTELWATIWQSLDELVENGDLEEKTPRGHIVGYLCEKLTKEQEQEQEK